MFGHTEQCPDENDADDEEAENTNANNWKGLFEFWKKIDLSLVDFLLLNNFFVKFNDHWMALLNWYTLL